MAVAIGLTLGTILTMIFGELVPKNLALAKPMETARATQRFQRAFTAVNRVPIRLLNGSANAVVRRLGIEPQEELRSARSSTELASLIQRSADQGTLDADTAELMERSVEFGTRTAGEIMTPRVRTVSLEATDRASAVIELARQTGHSRFPVLDDDEVVVGTVHVKHAVALPVHERATTRVKHLMAKPIVVPDSLRLDPLLALLREDGFQMAVVLDEYGGHAGIVTLEDVIEEIVGDIADEHDRLGARARQRRDGGWSLSGLLRPDEVEDLTGVALPENEDYDTIAGLVLRVLGRVPERGRPRRGPGARPLRPRRARASGSPCSRSSTWTACASTGSRLRVLDGQPDRPGREGPPMSAATRPARRPAPAARQRVLRGRRVRPGLGAAYPDRAARRGRLPRRAHDPARDGEHLAGDRRQPARHHRLLAGARCGRRARRGPPASSPCCTLAHVPESFLHPIAFVDRAGHRGLPARRDGGDDPEEHRARRAGPGRARARPADLGASSPCCAR